MSDMAIGGNTGTHQTLQTETVGKQPQIIDVMTGEGTDRAGFSVSFRTSAAGVGEIAGIEDLTPAQVQDLEALLEILGLDGQNAKKATMLTVLQAVKSAIRQQTITVTDVPGQTVAISDYDVERLNALKKAMAESDDSKAQKVIENIDRMLELKGEIEDLANNKGLVYDGNFNEGSENFELNTRVREMGDRIADIRTYKNGLGPDKLDERLNTLSPAIKTAVKELLAAYDQTSGWGVQVQIAYSKSVINTVRSFAAVLESPDLKLPAQISKDALAKILKDIAERLGPEATAEQVEKELEEKMQEILAQLNEVAANRPIKA